MKERPLIFSAPMVRAILDGRKTQTRRVIKPQPPHSEWTRVKEYSGGMTEVQPSYWMRCPYGQPGDRLWVRETWRPMISQASRAFSSTGQRYAYRADHPSPSAFDGTWKPSIHMPKAASRITLEITGVRVERLQEIHHNLNDLEAEGVTLSPSTLYPDCNRADKLEQVFATLWDSINGVGAWDKNPWCWVLEFKI